MKFYLKMIVISILLVVLFVPWILACIIQYGSPNLWRQFVDLFGPLARGILGLKVTPQGPSKEELEKYLPVVYVGNHQSALDVITYAVLPYERVVAVGKKEIARIPFVGFIFKACGNIFIDRQNRDSAMKTMKSVADEIRSRKVSVVMYPEGTRNRTGVGLLPFKKGAFHLAIEAQVPIVPIVCSSLRNVQPRVGGPVRPGHIIIRSLDPISTSGMTLNDVEPLLARVRELMEKNLQEVTEQAWKKD